MIEFHDPRGRIGVTADPYELSCTLDPSEPARIAFLANGFPDSVPFLDAVAKAMQKRLPKMEAVFFNKGNASIPANDDMLAEIQRDCVAAVAAYGH